MRALQWTLKHRNWPLTGRVFGLSQSPAMRREKTLDAIVQQEDPHFLKNEKMITFFDATVGELS